MYNVHTCKMQKKKYIDENGADAGARADSGDSSLCCSGRRCHCASQALPAGHLTIMTMTLTTMTMTMTMTMTLITMTMTLTSDDHPRHNHDGDVGKAGSGHVALRLRRPDGSSPRRC